MKSKYSKELERYSIKSDQSLSTLGLQVTKRTIEGTTALHWHEYFEIELILKGKAFHHQNDTTSILQEGSLCFLTPIDFHQVEPIEPLEVVNITFNDSWIPSEFLTLFMNKKQLSFTQLSDNTFEYLKCISNKLCDVFSQKGQYRMFYIRNLMNCLLSELAYIFPSSIEQSSGEESNAIRRVLTYIYCNFRNAPSLHEVAQIAGLCDNYFSEVFRKATGQTFNRFLNDLKLQYAYDLLIHSKNSITEICFLSGFNSMTHFQREFKKKYNCAPSEKR